MIMTKGSQIKVNISAAVRLYQHGQQLLDEKTADVAKFMRALDVELMDGFSRERVKVLHRISEIESNPVSYMDHSQACASSYGSTSRPIDANVQKTSIPSAMYRLTKCIQSSNLKLPRQGSFLHFQEQRLRSFL